CARGGSTTVVGYYYPMDYW
nr:immunoglobulin heavy chain junction region [Mus musculus]